MTRNCLGVVVTILGIALTIGTPVCGIAAGSDAPYREMTVEQIADLVMTRMESIHSLSVEYDSSWKQLLTLSGFEIDVPRRSKAVFAGERRYFESIPLDPLAKQAPYSVVFDNGYTLTCDMKGQIEYGMHVSQAFLQKGRSEFVDRNDRYCEEVVGIPLSDRSRALWKTSWYYPYCLAQKLQPYVIREKQELVDGSWCHVVELPGWDRIWVDTRAYAP